MAAKLVLRRRKFDSATAALRKLNWLPIRSRIDFKVAVLVFKCVNGMAPRYLSDLLHPRKLDRVSRSSRHDHDAVIFYIPFNRRKTFADRSFSFSGPTVWNSLPAVIRSCKDIKLFRKLLKTHYMKIVFKL